MSNKKEFQKLVQEFLDSKFELEAFLEDLADNVKIDNVNKTIDTMSFKSGVVAAMLTGINMEVFEAYCGSLAEELSEDE